MDLAWKSHRARVYVVQRGDTPAAIGERFFGSAAGWKRIFEANRDRLDRADSVLPGQELLIPEREGAEEG